MAVLLAGIPASIWAYAVSFGPPRDDRLQRIIILACSFAEVRVERVVPDRHRKVVSTSFAVLLLPDAATFGSVAKFSNIIVVFAISV